MSWLSKRIERFSQTNKITQRWVVIDLETTGFDANQDSVVSIGAIALHGRELQLAEHIELFVKPRYIGSRKNILIHGIGEAKQRDGMSPQAACIELMDFIGPAPLVAFHAPFDAAFLGRAVHTYVGTPFHPQWLDAAAVVKAAWPQSSAKSLDDWLENEAIVNETRHSALGDAYATAMLLQKAMRQLRVNDFDRMAKATAGAKWLGVK